MLKHLVEHGGTHLLPVSSPCDSGRLRDCIGPRGDAFQTARPCAAHPPHFDASSLSPRISFLDAINQATGESLDPGINKTNKRGLIAPVKRELNMTISRREILKAGLAAGTALSIPSGLRAQTVSAGARTVHMVKGDLRIFDPIWTATNITADYGAAIYDTLFAFDSKFMPQPQMVGKFDVSDDKNIYMFELRDGLVWHDGTPVTAADCVASIRCWGQVAPGGQLIMALASDISKKDDTTFTISLKEPLGLLVSWRTLRRRACSLCARKTRTALRLSRLLRRLDRGRLSSMKLLPSHAEATPLIAMKNRYRARSRPTDWLAGRSSTSIASSGMLSPTSGRRWQPCNRVDRLLRDAAGRPLHLGRERSQP
ncbi:extracellular solute-binding protein (family 5) [Mesorhizobium loti]|uniref:Extracellular solute-binding protein (Family 5) n=1 Tax=Rhizobium loti TaxID=381 RepID=A0A8E3B0U6_RHILI|nr:extracellular solute-binding protein (family 5) [Mesorhizobium loti]